jgi:EmrB/QacA subfamily drug resistance transporter
MTTHNRLVPLIIACPMFLQNIDMTAMTIALPSIAASLHVSTLRLNLVITAYLLSLAVFLPMSAWLADRFGAKQMFCVAITLFSLASALCGLATSMTTLVVCRVLQGFGAALMIPVGRLILLRSVPPSELVAAMVWFTVPPTIGRLAGPLFGGAIVSLSSWHWIFFVNIPFGMIAVSLALFFVKDVAVDTPPPPFDLPGSALLAIGLAALFGALETAGKGLVSHRLSALGAVFGALTLGLYVLHSRKQTNPVIDLHILRFRTFRTNILGAAPLRIAMSAVPFLLPLMLQLGFGLSPLTSGLMIAGSALGGLCTRGVMRLAINRYGFRRILLTATVLTSVVYSSCALFNPTTSHLLIFFLMLAGGLFSSLCMVSINTLGFVDVPKERMSHATALTGMAQQLMSGTGVVLAASLLEFFSRRHGGEGTQMLGRDFSAAILVAGPLALLSLLSFLRLNPKVGDKLR